MQVNDDYYEDLDVPSAEKILDSFLENNPVKPGSSKNRTNSSPENKKTNGINNA